MVQLYIVDKCGNIHRVTNNNNRRTVKSVCVCERERERERETERERLGRKCFI